MDIVSTLCGELYFCQVSTFLGIINNRVFVFPENQNWHSQRTYAHLTLFYNHHHHHHTAAWVRTNTSRQQWNNSILYETFGVTRALLFVSALVHFTFRVNDERDAKVCANEEEVFQVSICEGANEYAAVCWLTLIWVKLVPFKIKRKLNILECRPTKGHLKIV